MSAAVNNGCVSNNCVMGFKRSGVNSLAGAIATIIPTRWLRPNGTNTRIPINTGAVDCGGGK
nr:hypothetical protein [Thiospirillum jenense]